MTTSAPPASRPAPWAEAPEPPRRPRWATLLRILLPALLIVGWLAVAGVGGPYFGKISEVSTNDQSSFLPESTESTQVTRLLGEFRDSEAIPAIVLLVRDGGLTGADRAWAEETAAAVEDSGLPEGGTSPLLPSEDGEALQLVVPLPDGEVVDDVEALAARFEEGLLWREAHRLSNEVLLIWGREGSLGRARRDGFETAIDRAALFEQSDVLIYAAGEYPAGTHSVTHAGKRLHVVTLDLAGEPARGR